MTCGGAAFALLLWLLVLSRGVEGYTTMELLQSCALVTECSTTLHTESLPLFVQLVSRNTFPAISGSLTVNDTVLLLALREEKSGRCLGGSQRVLQGGLVACECIGGDESLCSRCPRHDLTLAIIVILVGILVLGATVRLLWGSAGTDQEAKGAP